MNEAQASEIIDRERGSKLCPVALDGLAAVRSGDLQTLLEVRLSEEVKAQTRIPK